MSNDGSMSNNSYLYDDDAGKALFAACCKGNLEEVRELLKRCNVSGESVRYALRRWSDMVSRLRATNWMIVVRM